MVSGVRTLRQARTRNVGYNKKDVRLSSGCCSMRMKHIPSDIAGGLVCSFQEKTTKIKVFVYQGIICTYSVSAFSEDINNMSHKKTSWVRQVTVYSPYHRRRTSSDVLCIHEIVDVWCPFV